MNGVGRCPSHQLTKKPFVPHSSTVSSWMSGRPPPPPRHRSPYSLLATPCFPRQPLPIQTFFQPTHSTRNFLRAILPIISLFRRTMKLLRQKSRTQFILSLMRADSGDVPPFPPPISVTRSYQRVQFLRIVCRIFRSSVRPVFALAETKV